MDSNVNTITIIIAGVTIFAAVVNLITVTVMFGQLANTIARVLEQVLIKPEKEVKKEVENE